SQASVFAGDRYQVANVQAEERRVDQRLAAIEDLIREAEQSAVLRLRDPQPKLDLAIRRRDPALVLTPRRRERQQAQDQRKTMRHAQLKPDFANGRVRTRFPVAEKIAFATAGRIGGSAGSPRP